MRNLKMYSTTAIKCRTSGCKLCPLSRQIRYPACNITGLCIPSKRSLIRYTFQECLKHIKTFLFFVHSVSKGRCAFFVFGMSSKFCSAPIGFLKACISGGFAGLSIRRGRLGDILYESKKAPDSHRSFYSGSGSFPVCRLYTQRFANG